MKIFNILCLTAALLMTLAGCQLAREDGGGDGQGDRLIGVLITREHLDLFDMDGYIKDHAGAFTGGSITIPDDAKYRGRLYAALQERTLTDESTGQTVQTRDYVFTDIEGIAYFAATIPAAEGEESYLSTGSDEAISDGHTALHSGDDSEKITLEGTIYMTPGGDNNVWYTNPVYQTRDGAVYALTGSGFGFNGVESEGAVYTTTMEEKNTVTENGKSKTREVSVKISFSVMLPPEKIAVLQMDAAGALLSRREYAPGELPEALTPEAGTAFIVLETHKRDAESRPAVSRALYGADQQAMESFYRREDGVCVKRQTALDWPED